MQVTVRRLVPEDAEACAALRRGMLVEAPTAFLSSPGSDHGSDPEAVREQLGGGPHSAMFGAFAPELVGSVGLFRDRHPKAAHRINVWGMYVAPAARGTGLGRRLMEALLAHVRDLGDIGQVHLGVSESATAARALYESLGFLVWGSEPGAMRIDGRELVEHHMLLRLAADDPERALERIRASPLDEGTVELIVCRPGLAERELLEVAELDTTVGLVGDNWSVRGSKHTPDGGAHPGMQLTLMNARVIAHVAGPRERWALAGDQFYVDLELSTANLPPGTRLALGMAEIEVTDVPHTGCAKWTERFGSAATRLVNSTEHRALNLRGINTRVVRGGSVRLGDRVRKLAARSDGA